MSISRGPITRQCCLDLNLSGASVMQPAVTLFASFRFPAVLYGVKVMQRDVLVSLLLG